MFEPQRDPDPARPPELYYGVAMAASGWSAVRGVVADESLAQLQASVARDFPFRGEFDPEDLLQVGDRGAHRHEAGFRTSRLADEDSSTSRRTPDHECPDPVGRLLCRLVFPYPNGRPARVEEQRVGLAVARLVPFDLFGPVPAVRPMLPLAMVWATVPEATVHEDGDLRAGEHEIRLAWQLSKRSAVDEVAQSPAVKDPPESQLGPGVPPGEPAHL